MWKIFIDQWNGIELFLSPLWETSDTLSLFTDASGPLGYVFFFFFFSKKIVSGKMATISTTGPAWDQHPLARTICN